MVTNNEKLVLLESRLITLTRLKWNKMSSIEKKLEKSFERFLDKHINKFISDVMKDVNILETLNEFVDRTAYPDEN